MSKVMTRSMLERTSAEADALLHQLNELRQEGVKVGFNPQGPPYFYRFPDESNEAWNARYLQYDAIVKRAEPIRKRQESLTQKLYEYRRMLSLGLLSYC